jgi:BirA family biotin operon repressor/biotin-[acetyl-CoA-carboxylase] ligase
MPAVVATRWEGVAVDVWRARWRLPHLEVFACIGSTNDRARLLAEAGAHAGTVVIAEEQTAGRGRYGRHWTAPAGKAVLLSIVLRPGRSPSSTPAAPATGPVRVALAVARAIERTTGMSPGVKWPNDVVVPGAGKVAGILCEGSVGPRDDGFVVAGVGINTGQAEADFPDDLRARATSLALVAPRPFRRTQLVGTLLDELRPFDLARLDRLAPAELAELVRRDVLRGRQVEVVGVATGTAAGIAPDAALILDTADGVRLVYSGSVRPAVADTSGTTVPRR